MLQKIVTIPRTKNVFLRESITGVGEPYIADHRFSRIAVKIHGVGFSVEVQCRSDAKDVPGSTYEDLYEDAVLWHKEVVEAIFGETK